MNRIATNRAAGVALLGLLAVVAVFAGYLLLGPGGADLADFFNNRVYYFALVGTAILCFARAIVIREERWPWILFGLAFLLTTTGDLYYTYGFSDPDNIPFPSLADAFYLAFFPPCYVAIGLLVRSRFGSFGASLWLDGIVAGLTVAAIASALVFQAVLDVTSGSPAAVATNLAYPLADFTLLALAVGAVAASGWRLDRTWGFMLAGLAIYATVDSVYLYKTAVGTYTPGTILDASWPFAATLFGFAAWQPAKRADARIEGWASMALPPLFALASIAVLVVGQFRNVNTLAIFLACGALTAVLVRLVFTFKENLAMIFETRRLNALQREYIDEVEHVTDAAAAVESETFQPALLDSVAERDDALGNLARVFQRMAREVYEREQRLKAQVQALKIEIDEAKAAKKVEEITETDYFRDLQKKAASLRLDSD